MMKITLTLTFFLLLSISAFTQSSTSQIPITEVFSANGKFSLKSFSYDDEFPTTRGKSIVYKGDKKVYEINRSFDVYTFGQYFLTISNDGSTIAYLANATYSDDGFKNVVIYKNGKRVQAYTTKEFSSCNPDVERCQLFYNNSAIVVDNQQSKPGFPVFKTGTTAEEKFLNQQYVMNDQDTIYCVDSKKIVTVYDLKKCEIVKKVPFESVYQKLKDLKPAIPKTDFFEYAYKYIPDFVILKTQKNLALEMEEKIGLKYVGINTPDFFDYKIYRITLAGYLNKNGNFEIDTLSCPKDIDEDKIRKIMTANIFDASFLSEKTEKQYFKFFSGGFRNPVDSLAKQELLVEKEAQKKERVRRLTLDSINHIYIPVNLNDCFLQLDKILKPIDKETIKNYKSSGEMLGLHHGLGMWIRNNWGLWGGSRLQVYFGQRGFSEPDGVSGIILDGYYDWIKGETSGGAKFEQKYPVKN
ncbi:DUF6794 domain-containing protein [Pedobacter soli]|uniref:DUF6794 domain-containing protein n=1 Tax=Pedobacter soli TaxID=390242 RepID=A0A1G6J744_9SPHI|nr:DUF6794 domain-containing protein [Pedobacter soli]SDC14165.1 hypothetical protein SAMN04488024_101355 [Pedobacter soli]